jgi:peroxygenase
MSTPAREPTALERHVAYFDRDGDGRIRVGETIRRIHDLGVGWELSFLLAMIIHVFLGPITSRGPRLTIDVSGISRGVHAGDTGIFDKEGRFAPAVFDQLWEETLGSAGHPHPGAERANAVDASITKAEFLRFMKAHGEQSAVGGWFSWAEASILFCVGSDAYREVDGKLVPALSRRRLRRFYAGTLLPSIARLRRLPSRKRRDERNAKKL